MAFNSYQSLIKKSLMKLLYLEVSTVADVSASLSPAISKHV